jgi:hypothetical protein
MQDCYHCSGSGRCQNDFHSGGRLFGGEDAAGQVHPSLVDSVFGSCPSCGDGNTEWRPECPHCDGTGNRDPQSVLVKKTHFWPSESIKKRDHRREVERTSRTASANSETGSQGWLGQLVEATLWFGRDISSPDWHPAIRLVMTWMMPAFYSWGILWYISEVLDALAINIFEGIAAFFLAWIAIPIAAICGLIATGALWGVTSIAYVILHNRNNGSRS